MDVALKYSALAVVAVICGIVLKDVKSSASSYIVMFAGVSIVVAGVNLIPIIIDFASGISQYLPELDQACETLFKVCGITFITRICAQTCSDCGEGSLGMKLELLGNLLVIVSSLPLLETVFSLIAGLFMT